MNSRRVEESRSRVTKISTITRLGDYPIDGEAVSWGGVEELKSRRVEESKSRGVEEPSNKISTITRLDDYPIDG